MFKDQQRCLALSAFLFATLTTFAHAQNGIAVGTPASNSMPIPTTVPVAASDSNTNEKSIGEFLPSTPGQDGAAGNLANQFPAAAATAQTAPTKSMNGITIPAPPPPAAFTTNTSNITAQAEQTALQAQAQAAAAKEQDAEEHNKKSYERAAGGLLPLAPDQIRDFMHRLETTDEAARNPSYGVPLGDTRIVTLSLDPGATPPVVNLQAGFVTTINVVDSSGQPWPILDVGVGGNFEVNPSKSGLHIVRIMPLSTVADGNLSLMLKDLSTPVIFRLQAGNHKVDMRFDARVPKFGPYAKIPLINKPRLEAGNENLMMILQNVPPPAAKRMKISGLDARTMAWSINDHVFVRTPLTLLSPAWDESVSSDDGMTVYEVGDAPVLLMSDNGALIRAHILQDEDHDR